MLSQAPASTLNAVLERTPGPVLCHCLCDLTWPSLSHLEMEVSNPCSALPPGVSEEQMKEYVGSLCQLRNATPISDVITNISNVALPAKRQHNKPSASTSPSR